MTTSEYLMAVAKSSKDLSAKLVENKRFSTTSANWGLTDCRHLLAKVDKADASDLGTLLTAHAILLKLEEDQSAAIAEFNRIEAERLAERQRQEIEAREQNRQARERAALENNVDPFTWGTALLILSVAWSALPLLPFFNAGSEVTFLNTGFSDTWLTVMGFGIGSLILLGLVTRRPGLTVFAAVVWHPLCFYTLFYRDIGSPSFSALTSDQRMLLWVISFLVPIIILLVGAIRYFVQLERA